MIKLSNCKLHFAIRIILEIGLDILIKNTLLVSDMTLQDTMLTRSRQSQRNRAHRGVKLSDSAPRRPHPAQIDLPRGPTVDPSETLSRISGNQRSARRASTDCVVDYVPRSDPFAAPLFSAAASLNSRPRWRVCWQKRQQRVPPSRSIGHGQVPGSRAPRQEPRYANKLRLPVAASRTRGLEQYYG